MSNEIVGNIEKVWQGVRNGVIRLLTLIERGLDVPGILQDLTREAQAGNVTGNEKQGKYREK